MPKQVSSAVSRLSRLVGEKLVKGREVYCTKGDGGDGTGTGKNGCPSVFVRPGLLSPRGERKALPIPGTGWGGKLSPASTSRSGAVIIVIIVAPNPAIPAFARNGRALLRLPLLLYNFVGSN